MNQAILSLVVCFDMDRPRYRVQDGSWPNHKNFEASGGTLCHPDEMNSVPSVVVSEREK